VALLVVAKRAVDVKSVVVAEGAAVTVENVEVEVEVVERDVEVEGEVEGEETLVIAAVELTPT
jgi:hypothetical protein